MPQLQLLPEKELMRRLQANAIRCASSLPCSRRLRDDLHDVGPGRDVGEVAVLSLQLFGKPGGLVATGTESLHSNQSPLRLQTSAATSHRLERNENKSANDWAEPAPYAGVRVIIRTPIYFFLVAVLPGDGQQYTTQTQSVARSPQTPQAFSFYECLSSMGGK